MAQIQMFHHSLTQFAHGMLPIHSDHDEMSYSSLFYRKTEGDSLDMLETNDEELFQRKRAFEHVPC